MFGGGIDQLSAVLLTADISRNRDDLVRCRARRVTFAGHLPQALLVSAGQRQPRAQRRKVFSGGGANARAGTLNHPNNCQHVLSLQHLGRVDLQFRQLQTPRPRTESARRSVVCRATRPWNRLPVHVRCAPSCLAFKRRLRREISKHVWQLLSELRYRQCDHFTMFLYWFQQEGYVCIGVTRINNLHFTECSD